MRSNTISTVEKLLSAISYITMGWGGMIVVLLLYFCKKQMSRFLRYNIFQSIFVSLLFFCIAMLIGFIANILSYIPGINYLVAQISFLLNRPLLFGYSFIQTAALSIVLYMAIISLTGRLPRLYFVSKIIDRQVK